MACSVPTRDGPPISVRDSLGIRIVENIRPQWTLQTAWQVDSGPRTIIRGSEDSPTGLTRPRNAVRLSDGRIVVADEGESQIRVYDPRGRWLANAGRAGEGPSEFRALWWVRARPMDSILAYDVALQRFSIFDPDLHFIRSYRLRPEPGVPTPSALDVFTDGSPLVLGSLFGREGVREGINHEERGLYRRSLATGEYDSLPVTWRRTNYRARFRSRNGLLAIPVPFEPHHEFVPWRHGLATGRTDHAEWRFITPAGGTEGIFRIDRSAASVTRADRDAAFDLLHGRSAKPDIQRAVARAWGEMPLSRRRPLFGRWAWERVPSPDPDRPSLIADAVGNLWILRYTSPGQSRPWDVLDSTGVWLGAVTLPDRLEPWAIGEDYVLGWRKDSLGLIDVVLYDLRKPA